MCHCTIFSGTWLPTVQRPYKLILSQTTQGMLLFYSWKNHFFENMLKHHHLKENKTHFHKYLIKIKKMRFDFMTIKLSM
jgi:hypothetical protein